MTTYTVAMTKGGTAKTITAAELVAYLAAGGRRVLAVDLDSQGDLSRRLGITDDTELVGTAATVLAAKDTAQDAAVASPVVAGVHVLVGTIDITRLLGDAVQAAEIATALRDELRNCRETWDDVVIDTPPDAGAILTTGLAAADVLICPVDSAAESWRQLDPMVQRAERLAKRTNRGLGVDWIVPTRHNPRRVLDRDVIANLRDAYGDRVTSPIREAVVVKESFVTGAPLAVYAPDSAVANDYRVVFNHITGASR